MDVDRILRGTACPAFVINPKGRVAALNTPAESLFGTTSDAARGQKCCDLFDGVDQWGNRFCHGSCAPLVMERNSEPVSDFEVRFRTAPGGRVRVSVSIVPLYGSASDDRWILHLVRPVKERAQGGGPPGDPSSGDESDDPRQDAPVPDGIRDLTGREIEVLRLLAAGKSPRVIATALSISVRTVRNHLRNIFEKLHVHRQAEAVSIALRTRLI